MKPDHGEKHGNAKLRDSDVREIRRLHLLGLRGNAIAIKVGISRAVVSKVVTGKSWGHVR